MSTAGRVDELEAAVKHAVDWIDKVLLNSVRPSTIQARAALSELAVIARDGQQQREMYAQASDRMVVEILEREAAEAERDRYRQENDVLRGKLAESPIPCIYCGEQDMAKCPTGFPGCGRADDLMAYDDARAALSLPSGPAEEPVYCVCGNILGSERCCNFGSRFGDCVECGRPLTSEEAVRSDACLKCDPSGPAEEEK